MSPGAGADADVDAPLAAAAAATPEELGPQTPDPAVNPHEEVEVASSVAPELKVLALEQMMAEMRQIKDELEKEMAQMINCVKFIFAV